MITPARQFFLRWVVGFLLAVLLGSSGRLQAAPGIDKPRGALLVRGDTADTGRAAAGEKLDGLAVESLRHIAKRRADGALAGCLPVDFERAYFYLRQLQHLGQSLTDCWEPAGIDYLARAKDGQACLAAWMHEYAELPGVQQNLDRGFSAFAEGARTSAKRLDTVTAEIGAANWKQAERRFHELFEPLLARDYPSVQVGILLFCVSFLVINLVVDLAYAAVDPRISY